MPCLIITGYPSAGKTKVSRLLKERALLRPEIGNVILLNEESACPDHTKHECYVSTSNEKQTRAALKSVFDRSVGAGNSQQSKNKRQTLVILDSLNYIKGFRYELHCISKASGDRHGVLWVLNRPHVVEEWNSKRPERDAYQPNVLRELIQRYEPPDDRNRWDKPLYTIDVAPPGTSLNNSKSEAVQRSVYNMHALGEAFGEETSIPNSASADLTKKKPKKSAFSRAKPAKTVSHTTAPKSAHVGPSVPVTNPSIGSSETNKNNDKEMSIEERLDDILDSFLREKPLKEGHSTRQHIAGNANVLQELDSTTQRLISTIANAQNFHTGGNLQLKTSGGISLSMNCNRRVALPELRRLRKQYLLWVTNNPPEDSTEKGIAISFLKYLEEQL